LGLLIAFAGLPGAGKSAIAQELALRTGALWLRIDSIEQAILDSGAVAGELADAGYRAAQAVAIDNLRLGRDVVADCVNDWKIARDGWEAAALRAGVPIVWVEVVCSDTEEHRRRVESRAVGVPGLKPPDWASVVGREYHAWDRERLVVDTAGSTLEASVELVLTALRAAL
jgi:predicted kinase